MQNNNCLLQYILLITRKKIKVYYSTCLIDLIFKSKNSDRELIIKLEYQLTTANHEGNIAIAPREMQMMHSKNLSEKHRD